MSTQSRTKLERVPKLGDTFTSPDHFRIAMLRAAIPRKLPLEERTETHSIRFVALNSSGKGNRAFRMTLSRTLPIRRWRVVEVDGFMSAVKDGEEWEEKKESMLAELQRAEAGVEHIEEESALAGPMESASISKEENEGDIYYRFPTVYIIKEEVQALMDSNSSLTLPSADFIFPTSRACLIHIWAVIRQRQLAIWRNTAASTCQHGFVFICSKYRTKCSASVKVEPVEGGWCIASAHEQHDHLRKPPSTSSKRARASQSNASDSASIPETELSVAEVTPPASADALSDDEGGEREAEEGCSEEFGEGWQRLPNGTWFPIFNNGVTLYQENKEAEKNSKSRFLPFPYPSSSISFASRQEFRLHVISSAKQKQFSVKLIARGRNPASDSFSFRWAQEKDCEWKMDVKRRNGVWKCVRTHGRHIHPVLNEKTAERKWEKEYGKKVAETVAQSDDGASHAGEASTSKKRTQAWVEIMIPGPAPKCLRTDASGGSSSRQTPSSPAHIEAPVTRSPTPTPLFDDNFAGMLASFLFELSPHLGKLSEKLINAGLRSTEDVEQVLWWSESTCKRLATVAGLNFIETMMLVQGLRRARTEIQA